MTITQAIGWALVHFLWQGAALALVLAVSLRLLRSRPAALRYGVSLAVLFAMPVSAALTMVGHMGPARAPAGAAGAGSEAVPNDRPGTEETAVAAAARNDRSPLHSTGRGFSFPAFRDRLGPALPWVVGLWLLGVFLLAARHLTGWTAAQRLTRIDVAAPPERWRTVLDRLALKLGVRQTVTLLVSATAQVPAVVGWLKPVILVPVAALSGLTPEQVELLIAHELAHVRRFDYLVNVIQCAIESLLFYHPAAWWVSAQVRREREHCCDDLAVGTRGDAVAYAEALVAMEELRLVPPPAPALAAMGGPGSLLERIRRLVAPAEAERELFPRWIAGAVLSVGLFAAFAGVRWARAEAAPGQVAKAETAQLVPPAAPGLGEPAHIGLSEPAAAGQEPAGLAPDTVIRHPNPDASLAERLAWAEGLARRYRAYWIGYSVQPLWPGNQKSIYVGRLVRLHGKADGGVTFTGRMVTIGDLDGIRIPGVPVLKLVGGRPDDVALLMAFGGRAGTGNLERVQASTVTFPVDFERRPLLWLGRADDDASVALLSRFWDRARSVDVRVDLVSALGVHRSSELVVPKLIDILRGSEPDPVRKSAAEWLGWHPDRGALVALARAARTDRSPELRREAAESVGQVGIPAATDTLIALARTLEDRQARREAVESLSNREEPAALAALIEIARHDPSGDIRREAVETLGDFPDRRGVPALIDLARTLPDRESRREAVETIGSAAEPAEALAVLTKIAREDESEDVQREAVETLGALEDGRGVPAIEAIVANHPNRQVRREAVATLGEAAPKEALELLRRIAVKDESEDVRREAAETLGRLEDPRAVAALIELAEAGDDPQVAREAVETLGETNDPKALEAVARLAGSAPDEDVRREAVETYGESAPTKSAVELFRRLIATEASEAVQHEILETLAELPGTAGLPVLLEVSRNHPKRRLRSKAIVQLGEVDDPAARAALGKLVEKP